MSLAGQYKSEVKKAVELDGKNTDALWELMEFYWNAPGIAGGDQKKARGVADDIMRIDASRGYLALAELAQGKQEADVEDYYRKAEQADPKSYEVQVRLARFYLADKQKNHDLAAKHARQAIAIDPGRIGGYKAMAAVLAQQERWQELDVVLAESESRVPDDLGPQFQSGLETLLAGKDPVRAERYLRKYLTQEPEAYGTRLSRAHWRIGQALEKQGRKQEAIAEVEAALRMEPEMEEAKKDLKRLKQ
jgi:tetratricopeptide (TPR) repeat protein